MKLKRLLKLLATFIWSPMTCIQSPDGRHWILRLMYFCPATRYLPGDALVITFFMHSDFSTKLQEIRNRFSLTKHSQQPSNSNSNCYLYVAPINLKPTALTLAQLEVLEEVPITYDFSISEASNHQTKDSHIG